MSIFSIDFEQSFVNAKLTLVNKIVVWPFDVNQEGTYRSLLLLIKTESHS